MPILEEGVLNDSWAVFKHAEVVPAPGGENNKGWALQNLPSNPH